MIEDGHRASKIDRALVVIAWAFWFVLAITIRTRLSPRIGHIGGTNSDEAIVQLMANADGFSGFDLYYWAQERLGTWPFLFARLVRHLFGIGWTCDGLHWLLSIVFFSAVWPLRKLAGKWAASVAMSLLLALIYDRRGDPWLVAATNIELAPRSWHAEILAIAHPEGWMFAPLIWAWWFLRQSFEKVTAGRVVRFVLCAFLATWTSTLALGFLLAAVAIELTRHRRGRGQLLRQALLAFGGIAFAALFIGMVNHFYEESAETRHLWFERLPAELDWGHFGEDFHAAWFSFHYFKAWIAFPISLVLAIAVTWRFLRDRENHETELAVLAIAFPAMAVVNTLAVFCLTWGRIQGHPARYHALTDFFSLMGLCAAGLSLLPTVWQQAAKTPMIAALSLGAVTLWLMPANPASHRIPEMQQICAELAAAPDGVLLGNYWGTYAFVDGTAARPIVPVIQEMGVNRTEWTVDALREARTVLVSHTHDLRYGSPDDPLPYIYEHSTLLELVKPRAISSGGQISFSRYANRTADPVPVSVYVQGTHFSMQFRPRDHGTVVVFFGPPNALSKALPTITSELPPSAGVSLRQASSVMIATFKGYSLSELKFAFAAGDEDTPTIRAAVLLPYWP